MIALMHYNHQAADRLSVLQKCSVVTEFWEADQDIMHEINKFLKFEHL